MKCFPILTALLLVLLVRFRPPRRSSPLIFRHNLSP
jgi:hypothetical protein